MEALIVYFIKANIILALLYGIYWLLLKNEKFFALNRYILLGSIVVSFCLPLLPGTFLPALLRDKIPAVLQLNKAINNAIVNDAVYPGKGQLLHPQNSAATYGWLFYMQVAGGIYLLITVILLLRFGNQLLTVRRLVQINGMLHGNGINYLYHNKDIPPFSFFNYLAVNKAQYTAEELGQVIAHERVHIKHLHTVDVLLAEIVCIVLWINPLVYRLRSCIKLNLEFIADEQVLQTGIDKKNYQLNILSSCLQAGNYQLTNLFTSSKIKLRIKMMNTNKTPLRNLYKYAFILPVILAAYFVTSPVKAQPVTKVSATANAAGTSLPAFDKLYVVINSHTNANTLESIKSNLADLGVEFTASDINYKNGVLTNIGIDVNVPGVFKGEVTGKLNSLLTYPAIFYYERESGFHVIIGPVPGDVSSFGKKIVTNNLNGLLVVRNGSTELHGSCTW